MKTIQKPRILKVIAVGENRKSFTMAQIRLEGKWLVDAGLIPEKHVLITNPRPGVLVLHMQE